MHTDDKSLLINLTNHPSKLWDEAQLAAAREYGEVVDIPFPAVDEQGDEEYIAALADEYMDMVMEYAAHHAITVHLMGELTLCYALLDRLRQQGIAVVASTSKRIVTDETEGKKTVTFRFERFRRYC